MQINLSALKFAVYQFDKMSISIDNFLKTIFLLSQEKPGDVSRSLLASRLNVSSAAVTDMARKLALRGLVDYSPYKYLTLSDEGRAEALKIIRKHRLWELFLHKILDLDLKTVHEEAERLEHHSSDELMNHIDAFLGFPDFDPHGEPIPGRDGDLPVQIGLESLSAVEDNKDYVVSRLIVREPEIFDLFESYGIRPGVLIRNLRSFDFDRSMEVEIGDRRMILSEELVQRIFVTIKDI